MATALGNGSSVVKEHPSPLVCDDSSVCNHCGGWQCETRSRTRCHSDTKRPSTAVAWTQSPHLSCPISPRVRPATAIGWEGAAKKSWNEWDGTTQHIGLHEEDGSCEVSNKMD